MVDMSYAMQMAQDVRLLKICNFCEKAFIANNPKAEYDTPQCKNKANVYKSRGKIISRNVIHTYESNKTCKEVGPFRTKQKLMQENDDLIVNDLEYLNNRLKKADYDGMIHLADLVAKRGDYAHFNLEQRKNIFWSIFYFSKRIKVKIHTIIIDKRFKNNKAQLNRELATAINDLFNPISDYMNEFEKVVIYYDNRQEALGTIIGTLLITKNNVEHRIEFDHKEKRLFQVSYMLTFVDKIVYKHNYNIPLTKAEKYFFSVKDILGIIRQLKNKRL